MRLKNRSLIITLTALLFTSLGILPALHAAEFSADMETRSKGQVVTQGKIFMKGYLSRHEMNNSGRKVTVIARPDKGVAWTLMPQEKSYLEMTIDLDNDEFTPDNWDQDMKKDARLLGSETVNGVKCNKYELLNEDGKIIYWIAKKEELPVRIISAETEVNYRNIRSGSQPNHLFQLPAGYRKLVMPKIPGMPGMGNMQGMPGGGNMPSFPNPR